MHSRVSWWSDESIAWFERASAASDYHRNLVLALEKHLEKSDSIIELGCGLGHEAQLLHDDGFDVDAFDKDPRVIEQAVRRSGLDIFRCADATDVRVKADVLLCINYGHMETEDDFRRLRSFARKKMIYVISRHSGHGQDTRPDRTLQIERILKDAGVPFESEEVQLDFNQPLVSMEEAREFVRWTYLGRNGDEYMKFVSETDDCTYPYLFMNRKNLVLFDIGGNK